MDNCKICGLKLIATESKFRSWKDFICPFITANKDFSDPPLNFWFMDFMKFSHYCASVTTEKNVLLDEVLIFDDLYYMCLSYSDNIIDIGSFKKGVCLNKSIKFNGENIFDIKSSDDIKNILILQ